MFLLLMTSQIVNLKMINDVLVLRECYQCGGETLGPVVKHSVRDSIGLIHTRRHHVMKSVTFRDKWSKSNGIL
jgi:hypothetical protein